MIKGNVIQQKANSYHCWHRVFPPFTNWARRVNVVVWKKIEPRWSGTIKRFCLVLVGVVLLDTIVATYSVHVWQSWRGEFCGYSLWHYSGMVSQQTNCCLSFLEDLFLFLGKRIKLWTLALTYLGVIWVFKALPNGW